METMEVQSPKQEAPSQKKKKRFKINVSRQEVVHWLISNPIDTFLIVLTVVGIVLTINPLPSIDGADRIIRMLPASVRSNAINSVQWLTYDGGAQISGSVFFVLGAGIGLWRLRQHSIKNRAYWSTACPNCKEEHTLKRIHRSKKDKILNILSIPAKRYFCKNCNWSGIRLDENLV